MSSASMSEPISPDGAVGTPERLHPLFLISGLTGSFRGLAGAYALIGYLVVSGHRDSFRTLCYRPASSHS